MLICNQLRLNFEFWRSSFARMRHVQNKTFVIVAASDGAQWGVLRQCLLKGSRTPTLSHRGLRLAADKGKTGAMLPTKERPPARQGNALQHSF